jgi:hypothetical protein
MKKVIPWILLILVAAMAAWYYSVWRDSQEIAQVQVLPPPVRTPEPEPIQYPVEQIRIEPHPEPEPEPEPPPPPPLPLLEESDPEILEQMSALVGAEALERNFVLDMVISRMVATVDSLTGAKVAPLMLPVKPPGGKFMVLGGGEEGVISPENAGRYQTYVDLLDSLDTDQVVALYVLYYPLFQEAFEALGYPEAYFNDRLVDVLDHLLETPEPRDMMPVVQNEAVFEFADPSLEGLSAGQKMMLRLDEEQSRQVRMRLNELRAAVAGTKLPH